VADGQGIGGPPGHVLGELLVRATEQEAEFVKRLFTGELRQGALAGLMVDAVAKAGRRAPPPSGAGCSCSRAI
jgi:DNA ligase 1